jgi:hypothetical protein
MEISLIELKKEDLRDRLREEGVRFLTDEELGKKWAAVYNEGVQKHLEDEGAKIASKVGKEHLKRISDETGEKLSVIEARYKLLMADPYSWIHNMFALSDEGKQINDLKRWYKDVRKENRNLKREVTQLQKELVVTKDVEANYIMVEDKDGNKIRRPLKDL